MKVKSKSKKPMNYCSSAFFLEVYSILFFYLKVLPFVLAILQDFLFQQVILFSASSYQQTFVGIALNLAEFGKIYCLEEIFAIVFKYIFLYLKVCFNQKV